MLELPIDEANKPNSDVSKQIMSDLLSQYALNSRTKVEFSTKSGNVFQALLTSCSSDGLLQMKKVEVIRGIESLKTRIIDQILVKSDKIEKIKIISTDFLTPNPYDPDHSYRRSNQFRKSSLYARDSKSSASSYPNRTSSDSSRFAGMSLESDENYTSPNTLYKPLNRRSKTETYPPDPKPNVLRKLPVIRDDDLKENERIINESIKSDLLNLLRGTGRRNFSNVPDKSTSFVQNFNSLRSKVNSADHCCERHTKSDM